MVVTSSFVTKTQNPILEVSHEDDEEGGSLWQFHSGNGDYSAEKIELVRFDTVVGIDPSVLELTNLEMGYMASRPTREAQWEIREIT